MKVKVIFWGEFSKNLGVKEDELEFNSEVTALEVLMKLAGKYGVPFTERIFDPETRKIHKQIIVLVNGYNIRDSLERKISDNSYFVIMAAVVGG